MPQEVTRVKTDGLHPTKPYNDVHFYPFDVAIPGAPVPNDGDLEALLHRANCDAMTNLFTNYVKCHVHNVWFPMGTTALEFQAWFEHEMSMRSEGQLLIFWFQGNGLNRDGDYKWVLLELGGLKINAHQLISTINESDADSLLLLDCFIHNRMQSKWKRPKGSTEIIHRAERLVDDEGVVVNGPGDFTQALLRCIPYYVHGINGEFAGHKQPKSLPDIMREDKQMHSNPQRIWLSGTREAYGEQEHKPVVTRARFWPRDIRAEGRLVFCMIQQQGKEKKLPARANIGVGDEGVQDMDDDSDFEPGIFIPQG